MNVTRWAPFLIFFLYMGLLIRSAFLATFAVTILVLLAIAYVWQKAALRGVVYKRRFQYTRAFPGETFPLRLEVENRKLLPLTWLRVQDLWPRAVAPEDAEILAPSHLVDQGYLAHTFSLRWYERTRRSYNLVFRKRGVYKLLPAQVESGDIFGLFRNTGEVGEAETLTVYPELAPLSELRFPAEDPFGDRRSRRRLFEDPNRPMGVREYRPEDGFRRVHWPATARTGQLQVKVFQPTSAQVMVLCLNASTFSRHWEGVYPALFEQLLSVAATLVDQGVQAGYRVGLISNGSLSNSDQPFRILPGRSPQQLSHLLQALAGLTPLVVTSFDRFLVREAPRVPFGSTLVVLTSVTPPELMQCLAGLKKHERQLTLVSLAEEPPGQLAGIRCVHMPFRG
ncbi:MAG: DUF58 domain-containing protein [Chloroflexi bacterium]|nr:DUF58 domain-containing protein [Chloroflexota bacterium]